VVWAASAQFTARFYLFAGPSTLEVVGGVAEGEWWRIITGGFLHANLLHLAFNMYALYIVGGAMERVVGWPRFLTIYMVSLLGGSAGALLTTDPFIPTVGASGAIFGLFGAFVFLQMSRGMNPMQGGIGPTILLNLLITFAIPGISKGGHIGGLVAGLICGYILLGRNRVEARTRRDATRVLIPVCLAVGLACAVLGVWAADYAASHSSALI
jgi:membrane associated rhomboid family serine protease